MSDWIKQAARQITPLAASGVCGDEDGNTKPTIEVIEEIIYDAYMDRDGELRDLLCCPPDCDLTSWAKRLGNFWHDLEGGQVVESLKQQLAEANARCAAVAGSVSDLLEIVEADYGTQDEGDHAEWHVTRVFNAAKAVLADIDSTVEQIAKDHRAMEAWRKVIDSNLGVLVSVSGPPLTSVWEVWCMGCANMIANDETSDPADAILAAAAAQKEQD